MSKKQKKSGSVKTNTKVKDQTKPSLFDKLENSLGKRHHLIALLITFTALLLSFLMFDAKISTGLDDSTYIEQGYKYSKDFFNHFFTSQAPFYAMILAVPIALFGINIVLLKILSVLFFVSSVYMLYRAFRYKISWLVLFSALFIYATNSEALKYASLTYTEAFYLLLQALFLLLTLKLISKLDNSQTVKKIILNHFLLLGTLSVLFYFLFLTRTVGIAAVFAIGAYYLLRKEWKLMLIVPLFFTLSYLLFEFIKKSVWSNINQFSTQSKILFQKDAYDASLGNEDFSGFITRLIENTNQYFSSRLYEILGFREHPSEWLMGLTLLTVIPIVIALIMTLKRKEQYVSFTILFTFAICSLTFLALQTSWGQARYIMIVLPFIFITLFWLLKTLFSTANARSYQFFGILIIAVFLFKNLSHTIDLAKANIPIAKANLFQGDKYAGYSPDWVNFLKLSEWCGKNLPDTCLVASRKAPMSFLYSNGMEFYPIWRTSPDPDPDSTLRAFKAAGVTHVIVGTLRVNTQTSQGGFINTVHRVLGPIQQKYPGKLEFVRQEGEFEDAKLFKINY